MVDIGDPQSISPDGCNRQTKVIWIGYETMSTVLVNLQDRWTNQAYFLKTLKYDYRRICNKKCGTELPEKELSYGWRAKNQQVRQYVRHHAQSNQE